MSGLHHGLTSDHSCDGIAIPQRLAEGRDIRFDAIPEVEAAERPAES